MPSKAPNEKDLATFIEVRKDLHSLAKEGIIDIFYVDESGFSLTPNIAYGWMPIGVQWGIRSIKKKVMNVLGFLNPYNDALKVYPLPEKMYMDSVLFIKYVDDFVKGIKKETVLFLDRASWHTSALTVSKFAEWETQGLFIVFLPAYCPHYNLIETLWRKVKYEWLNMNDYRSVSKLKNKLKEIFKEYGNLFNIHFSMNF